MILSIRTSEDFLEASGRIPFKEHSTWRLVLRAKALVPGAWFYVLGSGSTQLKPIIEHLYNIILNINLCYDAMFRALVLSQILFYI